MLFLDQVVDVRNPDFGGETGIDSASARAGTIQIGTGVVGVNNVFWLHTQTFKVPVEQWRVRVDVQHARNANAKFLSILHERSAFFARLIPEFRHRNRVSNALCIDGAEDFPGSEIHEVRILILDFVDSRLDVLHIIDIFDQTLLAGSNNEALFPVHQRNLGDFLNWHESQVILGDSTNVDKRPQTVVLAEIATRALVARRTVFDFANRLQADERCL